MGTLPHDSPQHNHPTGNTADDWRAAALARVALELSPRRIASLISRANDGDQEVINALAYDCVSVADLQELLRGQATDPLIEQFRWRGRWVGTSPRLFILTDSEERGLNFMTAKKLDQYRCFIYVDAAEVRRDIALNDVAGIQTEVLIVGASA